MEFTPEELKAQIESTEYVINTLKSELPSPANLIASYITSTAVYRERALLEDIQLQEAYLETLKSKVTPK